MGRWLTRDPLGYVDGMNLYGYCHSAPLGCVDPSGRDTPGCDVWAPIRYAGRHLGNRWTEQCMTRCCAQHDYCFAQNDCSAVTSWPAWIRGESSPCARCNAEVVQCIAGCAIGYPTENPAKGLYLCACWGYWFDDPSDPCMQCDSNDPFPNPNEIPPPPPPGRPSWREEAQYESCVTGCESRRVWYAPNPPVTRSGLCWARYSCRLECCDDTYGGNGAHWSNCYQSASQWHQLCLEG